MQKTLVAFGLAFFLLSSVVAAPVSAQAANDPKQPSVENPHMHFWEQGTCPSCWTHFDSNDSTGSSRRDTERGPTKRTGGNLLSCRMQDNLKDNMYLNPNGTILIEVGVQIFSDELRPSPAGKSPDPHTPQGEPRNRIEGLPRH